jgi:predicted nucleotidyltransferase
MRHAITLRIRRLSLSGSMLREDFNPERSDVGGLAEFEPGTLSARQ